MSKFLNSTDSNTPQGDASKRLSDRFGIPEHEVKKLLYGEQVRPNPTVSQGVPTMIPATRDRSSWNTISILGALLGVVGILSLVVLMIFLMRHNRPGAGPFGGEFGMNQPPPIMRSEVPHEPMPPAAMPDSCCKKENPPTTADTPPEPEAQTQQAKPQHKAIHKSKPSKGFVTSNSMEAEERLAELKADGNSKAKISSRKKDGVLMYEVK